VYNQQDTFTEVCSFGKSTLSTSVLTFVHIPANYNLYICFCSSVNSTFLRESYWITYFLTQQTSCIYLLIHYSAIFSVSAVHQNTFDSVQ